MKIAAFKIALLALTIAVGILVAKYSLANLNYLKVETYLTRWEHSNQLSREELNSALLASETMLNLHGHHPHYLNMAAKVYEWQAFKYFDNLSVSHSSLKKALQLYKKSTKLRPHWPLTWAYMANIKSQLGILDDDFYLYIDKAIVHGPYMQEVNLELSKLFLKHWGSSQNISAQIGVEQIKRALYFDAGRNELIKYARVIGKDQIVCIVDNLNREKDVAFQPLCK
ncbi:hypothetical protein E2R68_03370 [Psychromonas sp. RZ22]|uniref:VpsP family polysaccharide biosynthesis protein n=1 Tax=Psychromonas algarum TaxID=2555643 RepID=UPI00106887C3|nr:VpsP family polysaccharide biosynthesis protein [Psychromonas sp. RZ22]TEW56147.1 hypothetical protein E2R68_03370 [Psychromonas sp. RZ22]